MSKNTIFVASLLLVASSAAHAVSIDFETAGQFADNFRLLNTPAVAQSSNGAANDFISHGTGTGRSFVYDTTPDSAVVKNTFSVNPWSTFTVSADVLFGGATNSFGFHIVNADNETQAYLALFNVNISGANDQFRFSSNVDPTVTGGTGLGNGSFPSNADVGVTTGVFSTISLQYTVNALNEPVFALTAGSMTSTRTFTGVTAFSNFEIGFRSFANSGTNQIDNITFNLITIPEPASLTLLGLAGVAMLGRRQRHQ